MPGAGADEAAGPAPGAADRPPRVFLSYANDSDDHVARVKQFDDLLRSCGVDTVMDQHQAGRINWQLWTTRAMQEADFVVLLASPAYRAAAEQPEQSRHLGAQAEVLWVQDRQHGDRETWQPKLLPVVLPGCRIEDIPSFLSPHILTRYVVDELSPGGIEELLATVFGRPLRAPSPLGRHQQDRARTPGRPVAGPADHWIRSVRGGGRHTTQTYFTGRTDPLRRLSEFPRGAQRGLCVVTGMPGAGKSAVLSVAYLRSRWPQWLPAELVEAVPDCRVTVAVHARDKSVETLIEELARATNARLTSTERARDDLLNWLGSLPERPVLVLDALDEAKKPGDVAELADQLSARTPVVVGVRPDGPRQTDGSVLLPGLLRSADLTLDLDADERGAAADVAVYVQRRLRADTRNDGYGSAAAWPAQTLVDVIGAEVAENVADRNFLVAGFVVTDLLARPVLPRVDRGWSAAMNWPTNLHGWIDHDLRRRVPDAASRAETEALLAPLAHALLGGITLDLWHSVAAAVVGAPITQARLRQVVEQLGFYLAVVGDHPQRFEFRHAAFAERFRHGPVDWSTDSAYVDALLKMTPGPAGARSWADAADYTRRNLFAHAARADRLEPLLAAEHLALAAVEPAEAAAALTAAGGPRSAEAAAVLRLAAHQTGAAFPQRAALLQFQAALHGFERLARELGAAEDMPWSTPWLTGAVSPAAYAIGAASRTEAYVPLLDPASGDHSGPATETRDRDRGPGAMPVAVVVRHGSCRIEDAITGTPLAGGTLIHGPDEPLDTFTAWQGLDGSVYAAAARAESAVVEVHVLARPGRGARPAETIPTDDETVALTPVQGPRGLDLLAILTRSGSLVVHVLRATGVPAVAALPATAVWPLAATEEAGALLAVAPDGSLSVCRLPADGEPEVHHVGAVPGRIVAVAGDAGDACVLVDDGNTLRPGWLGDRLARWTVGGPLPADAGRTSRAALRRSGPATVAVTGDGAGRVVTHSLQPGRSIELGHCELGSAIREIVFLDADPWMAAAADRSGVVHILMPPAGGTGSAVAVSSVRHGDAMAALLPAGRTAEGPLLVTRSPGGLTRTWQIHTDGDGGRDIPALPAIETIASAAAPNGTDVVVAAAGSAGLVGWVVDQRTGGSRALRFDHGEDVHLVAAAALPDGVVVGAAGDEQMSLWFFGPGAQPRLVRQWPTDERLVEHLLLVATPPEAIVVVAAGPESLRIEHVLVDPARRTATALLDLEDEPVEALAAGRRPAGGVVLAAATDDGTVRTISLTGDGTVQQADLEHGLPLTAVAVTSDVKGRTVVAALDRYGTLPVWTLGADGTDAVIAAAADIPLLPVEIAAAPRPDRTELVVGMQGGVLQLWDLTTGPTPALVEQIGVAGGRPHHLTALDHHLVCASSDGAVVVADLRTETTSVLELNCDLAALAPATEGFFAAHDTAVLAIRIRGAAP